IVSPWMENGTIIKYLNDHGRANVDKLLLQIAQGLQYLHSRNVVHGDLRGANILLINREWNACLADFGLTSLSDATAASNTTTAHRAGRIRWMAPELIDPGHFGLKFVRTPATDVYAFGCVYLELYTRQRPFATLSETATLLRVINGDRPGRPWGTMLSNALWELVNECWAQWSAHRPATDAVVKHMIEGSAPRSRSLSPFIPPLELEGPLPSPEFFPLYRFRRRTFLLEKFLSRNRKRPPLYFNNG
ncbi:kinase-like domain-containing protein, partial [Mycena albidolilacea]